MIKLAFLALAFMFLGACPLKKNSARSYEFITVKRGSIERTVSSSGTINPVSTVKVLPQMSGKVEKIYVDFNDMVRKGDILAELNTDMLRLQREQQLSQVIKSRANYELQSINYRNQEALAEKNLISEYELKTGKTTLDIQAAELAAAEASLKVIETEINQYAYITAPISGIVLERNINVGDTVVDSSSSNSSNIFTLAENLKDMQIEALVGELDITSIRSGQAVRFSLESFPGRSFSGVVDGLHLVPTVQNNVVSYKVIINVENQDGSLLPGMTCAAEFIVERSENVLLVPNAALRYQPSGLSAEEIAALVFDAGLRNMDEEQRKAAVEAREEARARAGEGQAGAAQQGAGLAELVMGNAPRRMMGPGNRQGQAGRNDSRPGSAAGTAPALRNLWFINSEGRPDLVRVRAGVSDGSSTEIHSTEELEGKQFILREKI